MILEVRYFDSGISSFYEEKVLESSRGGVAQFQSALLGSFDFELWTEAVRRYFEESDLMSPFMAPFEFFNGESTWVDV